jgi:cytochrome P450
MPGKETDTLTRLSVMKYTVRLKLLYPAQKIHYLKLTGDVYRNGPNSLSFNTNTALEAIYGHKSNCWKGEFYTMFPARKNVYSTHSEIDKERHAHKRRVLSHAFSDRALKGMEGYILNQIRIFCAQIGSSPQPLDMASQCDYLTGDVLGDLCFGTSFGMQEKPGNRFIPDLVQKSAKMALLVSPSHAQIVPYRTLTTPQSCTMPAIGNWKLDNILFRELTEKRAVYAKYCMAFAAQRTKATTDRKDFFHYLLNAKDPETGEGFAMPELWAESSLLIVAGSDTSSTCLAGAFFYLTHNPVVLEKLAQEVGRTFKDVEDIKSGPLLSSCAHLKACIDEALRMSPPIGGFLPRDVLSGGATIDGHHVPAGAVVGCSAYSIHHNAAYFPSPFSYQPERWLSSEGTATKESIELAQSAFCPFSLGPRGCIGRNMAYMELLTTVARTVWLFDMKLAGRLGEGLPDGTEWGRDRKGEYQLEDVFVSRKEGPLVEFVKRTDLRESEMEWGVGGEGMGGHG